jgi:uncharacterized protein YecT (DUF1311 family)
MPHVNLTALNPQELRRLLDSSRRRGDAALSYKILEEMAARRQTASNGRWRKGARPPEPRHIEVDFGEAGEVDGLPPLPAGLSAREEAELEVDSAPADREPAPDFDRPLTLHDGGDEPPGAAPDPPPHYQPVALGAPPAPKRSRFRLATGLMLGAVLGIGIGWLGGWLARDGMARTAAPIQTAALAPLPAPAPPPPAAQPALETPADAALGPQPSDAPPATASTPAPAPPAKADIAPPPATDGAALELPAPDAAPSPPPRRLPDTTKVKKPDPAARTTGPEKPAEPPASRACATAPTPADRVICGDPKLKRLQADLRQAYEDALAAHEDRDLLREHPLAWRDTRSTVTDPARLARLYEERIRKLNAATAEARSLH